MSERDGAACLESGAPSVGGSVISGSLDGNFLIMPVSEDNFLDMYEAELALSDAMIAGWDFI